MPENASSHEQIDWSLTTWDGARREQVRRRPETSLREMILALEEMQALAERLPQSTPMGSRKDS